jgi:hypothetical protein
VTGAAHAGHGGRQRIERQPGGIGPRPAQSLRIFTSRAEERHGLLELELRDQAAGRIDSLFIFGQRHANDVGDPLCRSLLRHRGTSTWAQKRCRDNNLEQRSFHRNHRSTVDENHSQHYPE